jgi:hypothetical protein
MTTNDKKTIPSFPCTDPHHLRSTGTKGTHYSIKMQLKTSAQSLVLVDNQCIISSVDTVGEERTTIAKAVPSVQTSNDVAKRNGMHLHYIARDDDVWTVETRCKQVMHVIHGFAPSQCVCTFSSVDETLRIVSAKNHDETQHTTT